MKKREKKKGLKTKKRTSHFDFVNKKNILSKSKRSQKPVSNIKQSIAFKLLIVCLIILIGLVILYIFILKSNFEKEKELGGELGTLCMFCSENIVGLDVLNYTVASDNLSIIVEINWSEGNISSSDFNSILVDFKMNSGIDCNYTISSGLPVFGENIIYLINSFNPGCLEVDFSNVTDVFAYSEVDIHLTQKGIIPNLNFYKDDSRDNLVYLDNYFNALIEINYSLVESPANSQIEVVVNNFTKNISIFVLDGDWFGVQQFNLTAITNEGDILTTSFSITVIDDYRVDLNHEPEFDLDECEEIIWNKTTNKTLDMDSCWTDEDGDNLEYDYSLLNNYKDNISVFLLSGNKLKFVPLLDFNGSTYLTLYANDSQVRVSHRVYLYILGNTIPPTTPSTDTPLATNILELKSSRPSGSKVSFFVNEIKEFSIVAENYEFIEWYVDGVLVKEGVLSYVFEEKRPGNYRVEVKIINDVVMESKFWDVNIEEDEYIEERIFDIEIGKVIFYSIIIILVIIIFLVIWLLIVERKRRSRKKDYGFGVSVVPNRKGVNESSRQFNIPKD